MHPAARLRWCTARRVPNSFLRLFRPSSTGPRIVSGYASSPRAHHSKPRLRIRTILARRVDGSSGFSWSWSALVLRDGAAFLSTVPIGHERYFPGASILVPTIYLDTFLLGLTQRKLLLEYADRVAELGNPVSEAHALARLERGVTRFRNVLWGEHVTSHGIANELLRAYHEQTRLHRLADQVFGEVRDYASQIQTDSGRRTAAASTLVGFAGIAIGVGFGLDQVFTG